MTSEDERLAIVVARNTPFVVTGDPETDIERFCDAIFTNPWRTPMHMWHDIFCAYTIGDENTSTPLCYTPPRSESTRLELYRLMMNRLSNELILFTIISGRFLSAIHHLRGHSSDEVYRLNYQYLLCLGPKTRHLLGQSCVLGDIWTPMRCTYPVLPDRRNLAYYKDKFPNMRPLDAAVTPEIHAQSDAIALHTLVILANDDIIRVKPASAECTRFMNMVRNLTPELVARICFFAHRHTDRVRHELEAKGYTIDFKLIVRAVDELIGPEPAPKSRANEN